MQTGCNWWPPSALARLLAQSAGPAGNSALPRARLFAAAWAVPVRRSGNHGISPVLEQPSSCKT